MPKKPSYTKKDLEDALKAIKDGSSIKSASKRFGVPRATLHFRLSGKFVKSSFGPRPIISDDDEVTLVSWIEKCAKKGFPRRKSDILQSVKEFIELNNMSTPFKDNCPGDGWYKAFLRRHPSIAERTSEAVTRASACVSEADIRKWFNNVQEILEEEQCFQVLLHPERIFNADESGFLLNPNIKTKVLAAKGSRNVYEVDRGDAKSSLTVLFSFSATGEVSPPMVFYPYKRLPNHIIHSVPDDWGVGRSDTGWMKSELFFEYIANVFHPWLIKINATLPVILFVDGHKSHLTYHLSQMCSELKIILIALYPNATRILQPADVSAFKPLKNGWKNGLINWRSQNPEKNFSREDFAPVLKNVLDNCINKEILINGFRACGLYPWNANAIDYTKCLGHIITQAEPSDVIPIEVQDPTSSQKLMSLENFLEKVGRNVAEKLINNEYKSCDTAEGKSLQDLYSFFTGVDENNDGGNSESRDNKIEEQELMEICKTPAKADPVPSTSYSTPPGNAQRNLFGPSGSEESPLAEVLFWPESPKRKYKRNVQRLPYVVTSQRWKLMMNASLEEKRKISEKKEAKKLEREQRIQIPKKQKKEIEKTKKGAKQPSLCYKCGSILKGNFFDCSLCNKVYRKKCVKGYEHIPDSDDSDEFVCPACYIVESDEEN